MLDRNTGPDTGPAAQAAPDPVSELLMGMRLKGASYGKLLLSPPFGVGFPAVAEARFHFVASGDLLLLPQAGDPVALGCGDAVLLPRGDAHALASERGARVRPVADLPTTPLCEGVCFVDAHEEETCRSRDVLVFTGVMQFELDTMHPLVALMPQVMPVGTIAGRQPEIVPLLAAMEREMAGRRAGAAGILARLADVVAATIVRGWVESGCGEAAGWVAALRDRRLGRVLAALHRDPGRDWTVAGMATAMGSSRTVFAERFAAATGTTPLRYLAALRMRLAAQWLVRDRMPIDQVARRLGYASRAAFSRAYKRVTGVSPGKGRGGGEHAGCEWSRGRIVGVTVAALTNSLPPAQSEQARARHLIVTIGLVSQWECGEKRPRGRRPSGGLRCRGRDCGRRLEAGGYRGHRRQLPRI